MVFLADFYRHKTSAAKFEFVPAENKEIAPDASGEIKPQKDEDSLPENDEIIQPETVGEIPAVNNSPAVGNSSRKDFWVDVQALLFSGFLIGLLPYWNSAVFVAASIVLGSLLVFFPYRRYLAILIGAVILAGLPQMLMLASGNLAPTSHSLFQWGYTIAHPTVPLVAEYIGWTFGFKLILIFIALWLANGAQRRFFLAVSSLFAVVFLFRLSVDAFNNHKLLNVWNIFAGIYVAYALWRIGIGGIIRAALAIVLAFAMIFGAIIDLFPIRNDAKIIVPHKNDRLTGWVLENTKPSDVFLTYPVLTHPILFSGRKIFFGNTLFAWSAGYDLTAREVAYRRMFQERNVDELVRLLHENKIAYVAIDDSVRGNALTKASLNDFVYEDYFEKVFEDTERRYHNLTIYKVPAGNSGN
jgi:hypothetical protein